MTVFLTVSQHSLKKDIKFVVNDRILGSLTAFVKGNNKFIENDSFTEFINDSTFLVNDSIFDSITAFIKDDIKFTGNDRIFDSLTGSIKMILN